MQKKGKIKMFFQFVKFRAPLFLASSIFLLVSYSKLISIPEKTTHFNLMIDPLHEQAWKVQQPTDAWTLALSVSRPLDIGLQADLYVPKAYILTSDVLTRRYRYTAVRAAASGMQPVPHIGRWAYGIDKVHSLEVQKFCANKYGHKHMWDRFAADESASEDSWAFFFEDDVAISPPFNGAHVHRSWRASVETPEAQKHGVIELGMCGQFGEFTDSQTANWKLLLIGGAFGDVPPVHQHNSCGSCLHVLGLRKDRARHFFDDIVKANVNFTHDCDITSKIQAGLRADMPVPLINSDSGKMLLCLKLGGWPLVGVNASSEETPRDHKGLFYQDRMSFSSSLDASNYGGRIRSGVLATDEERAIVGIPDPSPSAAPSISVTPIPQYAIAISEASGRLPPTCDGETYQFIDYTPSSFESLWHSHASEWCTDECSVIRQPNQRTQFQRWLNITSRSSNPTTLRDAPALIDEDPQLSVFSQMRFKDKKTGQIVVLGIEPLAGILRDPRSICGNTLGLFPHYDNVQSTQFLGVDLDHLRRVQADIAALPRLRKVFLFDLGCTRWADSSMPGLRWLHDFYSASGLVFTDIFGWEADPSRSVGFFEGMPKDVLATFHFYPRPANNVPGSPDNPLAVLESVAKPEDFVVFKLDIDTPRLEKLIILDILRNSRYACLIDELFFEHHAKTAAMVSNWGSGEQTEGTLLESIELFQSLRRTGIRAHSWP